jgi:hypothetical protein
VAVASQSSEPQPFSLSFSLDSCASQHFKRWGEHLEPPPGVPMEPKGAGRSTRLLGLWMKRFTKEKLGGKNIGLQHLMKGAEIR